MSESAISHAPPMVVGVGFMMPIRTVSEANARVHWSARAKRARSQRQASKLITASHLRGLDWRAFKHLPLTITLTRMSPRKLDSDNLAGAFKAVRDGIADALGIDDGSDRLEWVYAQQKSKLVGVQVDIEVVRLVQGRGRMAE